MNGHLASAFLGLAIAFTFAASSTQANFVYVESSNGDLSNDRLNPTPLIAGLGLNSLTGTTVTTGPGATGRDFDYFTVTLPLGLRLNSIVLTNYLGDNLTFFGMMAGTPFTIPPTDPAATIPPRLLGWVHFTPGLVGSNLLPTMAGQTMPTPVIGFSAPLPPADYSFWLQETSANGVNYSLSFNVSQVPEPSTLALAGLVLALVGFGRRSQTGQPTSAVDGVRPN